MTITGIKVRKLLPEGRLKGVVSVTFDNEFCGVRVSELYIMGNPVNE